MEQKHYPTIALGLLFFIGVFALFAQDQGLLSGAATTTAPIAGTAGKMASGPSIPIPDPTLPLLLTVAELSASISGRQGTCSLYDSSCQSNLFEYTPLADTTNKLYVLIEKSDTYQISNDDFYSRVRRLYPSDLYTIEFGEREGKMGVLFITKKNGRGILYIWQRGSLVIGINAPDYVISDLSNPDRARRFNTLFEAYATTYPSRFAIPHQYAGSPIINQDFGDLQYSTEYPPSIARHCNIQAESNSCNNYLGIYSTKDVYARYKVQFETSYSSLSNQDFDYRLSTLYPTDTNMIEYRSLTSENTGKTNSYAYVLDATHGPDQVRDHYIWPVMNPSSPDRNTVIDIIAPPDMVSTELYPLLYGYMDFYPSALPIPQQTDIAPPIFVPVEDGRTLVFVNPTDAPITKSYCSYLRFSLIRTTGEIENYNEVIYLPPFSAYELMELPLLDYFGLNMGNYFGFSDYYNFIDTCPEIKPIEYTQSKTSSTTNVASKSGMMASSTVASPTSTPVRYSIPSSALQKSTRKW